MFQINKQYIKGCFREEEIQLSGEALDEIVSHLRVSVRRMATRCKSNNIKRLTSELMYLALGKYGSKK